MESWSVYMARILSEYWWKKKNMSIIAKMILFLLRDTHKEKDSQAHVEERPVHLN